MIQTTSSAPHDLTGKNCVVTGATSGIGRMAARALARMNANVILVGRNQSAGTALVADLQRRFKQSVFGFVQTDLSQPVQVHRLADHIRNQFAHLDIVVNNAGARLDEYGENVDGIELTFATNHLGHFLLTSLLLDRLLRAPAARIITVASGSHTGAKLDRGWLLKRADYDRRVAYANSKLANILFAYELARRLSGSRVTSNAVDPGGVASNFARNNGVIPWLRHLLAHALARNLVLPRNGARGIVHLAVADEVRNVSSGYFSRGRVSQSSPISYDRTAATDLWDLSVRLTNAAWQFCV